MAKKWVGTYNHKLLYTTQGHVNKEVENLGGKSAVELMSLY